MLVRDRLGTPVTEVGSPLDVRRIRKLKALGHTEIHKVLNFASDGTWVSGYLPFFFVACCTFQTNVVLDLLATISDQCVSESSSVHDLCLKLDI